MGKKVPLKGYLVYSPHMYEPKFLIGGVAKSCAGELAGEEGGFIVEMTGEVDMDQFVQMWEEEK
jgi:hypothetical protein